MTEGLNPSRLALLWRLGLGESVDNRAETFASAAPNCPLPQHKDCSCNTISCLLQPVRRQGVLCLFWKQPQGYEDDCFRSRLDCSRTRSLRTKVQVAPPEAPRTRTTAGTFLLPNSTVSAGNGERGGPQNSQTRRK